MRNFFPILGKSPFGPIQAHMNKAYETAMVLPSFFDAFLGKNVEKTSEIRKAILLMEHEADLLKNDIRDNLPKSMFLPVDRRDLLSLLHHQDAIADLAEDIVIVATLQDNLTLPDDLHAPFLEVVDLSLKTCKKAKKTVGEMQNLLASSFGGDEATTVLGMIDSIGKAEYQVDKLVYALAKDLYRREEEIGVTSLLLWQKMLQLVGRLANSAESIGDHLRLMLYS
ncbi:MAG: TIGR00153 family protein [Acidobacteria bacterium]|uniref:TIGR00153 family protein n=1 Tax=Candidatus Polarisedimenticola svalbardensis TaxID=2886004 RepID=A0A8J6Y0J3_9BACT|nr:TIGR00153 family protein [Candidatus Polarisedimenticola svalbardensis]